MVPPELSNSPEMDIAQFAVKQLLNSDGHCFLVADSGMDKPNRICVLASHTALRILSSASRLFIDGTFSVMPSKRFDQLLVIHCEYRGQNFPVVYALLCNEKTATDTDAFQMLKLAIEKGNFQPIVNPIIISDYEGGLLEAIPREFPYATVQGCYFHFTKAIRSQVDKKYKSDYMTDNAFYYRVKMIIALGFVPADLKNPYLSACMSEFGLDERIMDILENYFVPEWMNRIAPHLWTWFKVNIRKNNRAEGWDRVLNEQCGANEKIWKLVTHLRDESDQIQTDIELLEADNFEPARVDLRQRCRNESLMRECENFLEYWPLEFVENVALILASRLS